MQVWIASVVSVVVVAAFLVVVAWRSAAVLTTSTAPAAQQDSVRFPARAWFTCAVHVDSSWDLTDSWLSNAAAFGGAVGGLLTAAGGLAQYAGTSQGIVATTSLLFSAAALVAPVTFGAFGKNPDTPGPQGLKSAVVGSVGGLFAGAACTLFALFGELCLIGLVAVDSAGSGPDKAVIVIGLAIGAMLAAIYSARTLHSLVTYLPPAKSAADKDRAEDGAVRGAPSLLKGRHNVSGTL